MSNRGDPSGRHPTTVLAFILGAFFLFARLGELPLISPDEGRNAQVAREMKASGAWLVPSYNGFPYLDKPAFYFRTVALSMAAFGENEAAARLPGALFAFLTLLLLHRFCRRQYDSRTAALAVLVVSASPLFIAFARTVIFDMPLAFFILLSILSGYRARSAAGRGVQAWWALAAASSAAATLVKGPVGFIIPTLVTVAFGFTESGGSRLRRVLSAVRPVFSPVNLAIFFALTLPWFLGVVRQRPDFLDYGLVEESFRRYSTRSFHRTAPFYYYVPVILGTFFPFSLLLPESIALAWRARRRCSRPDRLFMISALVIVAFFSTSQSKLPGYILAAVIALGVLTARVYAGALADRFGTAARIVRRGSLTLAVIAFACGLFCLQNVMEPGRLQRFFHIHSAEFDRLQPAMLPLVITLAAMAVLGVAAWVLRRPAFALAAFLAFPAALLTLDFGALKEYAEAGSSRVLAGRVDAALRDRSTEVYKTARVAALEFFSTGLPFYLDRNVVLITRDGQESTSNYLSYLLRRTVRPTEKNLATGGAAATTGPTAASAASSATPGMSPWPVGVVPYELREPWLAGQAVPVYLLAGRRGHDEFFRFAAARGVVPLQLVSGVWGALFTPPVAHDGPDIEAR